MKNDNTLFKYTSDFLQKLRWSNRAEAQAALSMVTAYSKDFGNSAEERKLYREAATIIRRWLKDFATDQRGRARNPQARKKNPVAGRSKGKPTNIYEIYTKHPTTGEGGWNILFVRSTKENIKSFPLFDEIITINDYPMSSDRSGIVNWNGVRITKNPQARKKNPIKKLMARKELQPATRLFVESVNASKEHIRLTKNALEKYGDHGAQISGVIRDHFPQNVKDELRKLARQVTEFSDKAYAARPRGVRQTTMRALGREVASQHGYGFYGPRPNPKARKKNPVHEIRELILFAENSERLTNQFTSIMKNLEKKAAKGTYDPVLAAKLWKYWIDNAVKEYNFEFLSRKRSLVQNVFSVQDRKDAAIEVEAQWRDDVMRGDNPKARKKNPAKLTFKSDPRTKVTKTRTYKIFRCAGNEIYWLKGFTLGGKSGKVYIPSWTLTRGDGHAYKQSDAKFTAEFAAQKMGANYKVGLAKSGTTNDRIIAKCSPGKA